MSGASGGWAEFFRSFVDAFLRASRKSKSSSPGSPRSSGQAPGRRTSAAKPSRPQTQRGAAVDPDAGSPGQFGPGATRDLRPDELRGIAPSYAPQPDGDPDPGEIVWTWVPYVENDGRGKDRPVLIIARIDDDATVGCYLSTKQHRGFVSIGRGPWDSQGRESFLSPERLLRVTHDGMRREGTVLPRERFDPAVAAVLREHRRN